MTGYLPLIIIGTLISTASFSQTPTGAMVGKQKVIDVAIAPQGYAKSQALQWLPDDYSSTTKKYPLMIFLHTSGAGESKDVASVAATSLPQLINEGLKPYGIDPVSGDTLKYIVVSPHAAGSSWSYSVGHIKYLIPYLLANFRIDASRIYVSGASAGGWGTWSIPAEDVNFTKNNVAAIVPISAVEYNEKNENIKSCVRNNLGIWQICGTQDAWMAAALRYDQTIKSALTNPNNYGFIQMQGAGHGPDTWNPPFYLNSTLFRGKNLWSRLLDYKTGTVQPPPVNQAPVTSAGTDQTITLPSNSITLNGSATDADGSITSYKWTKTSGGTATITSSSTASTTVTGLAQGSYVFRLTATDNSGAASFDEINVTVNPAAAPANQAPATNAGADKVVTLPANSVTLSGSAVDGDGSITAFQWTKTSGGAATITSPASASTTITGLVQGNYIFRLTATDDKGATAFDDVNVIVSNSVPSGASLKIQAEAYSNMSGIQTENTADAGGGKDVAYINNGDWMDYAVNLPSAGIYTVNFRIATSDQGGEFQLRAQNGTVLATITVPNTGSYQYWFTTSVEVNLPTGNQTLRLVSTKNPGWNINWLEFVPGLIYSSIPGKIEAENYSSMKGILTEYCQDANNGLNTGWIDNTDWLSYNVNVASTGSYTVNVRVATDGNGGRFNITKGDGTILSTVNVPSTGGYQSWRTIQSTVSLTAGQQQVRIVSTNAKVWNYNWIEFISNGTQVTANANTATAVIVEEDSVVSAGLISLYPNPIYDRFTVKVSNNYRGAMNVQLIDASGAIKEQFNDTKEQQEINKTFQLNSGIPPGQYVVRVLMGNYYKAIKIVKL